MPETAAALKWGVERRLEFIEFRLYWEGGVNRSDIIEAFDVSVPQASKDLTLYQERAPHNAIYDKSAKRYIASNEFQPCFLKPDAGQYLNQLRSVAEGILTSSEAWIAHFPPYAGPPVPARGVNNDTLRTVLAAVRQGQAVEIKYQSLSSDDPRWRWIAPHAIGFDGFRWHSRAFCEVGKSFKDFLLSRIIEVRSIRPSEVSPEDDTDWNEFITLEIGPHPELSESQKRIIALDYGMRAGRAQIQVRKALRYYALRRLGLDTPLEARRPQDQQIVLLREGAADENHR
ncbi:WYL domain-containing protein [Labrys neptuniae]|uniref:WYL domain-containing protein n=1 Tax=Labrys neptuniae TaxID=376174 RepID=A0ABV3PJT5_9HYPH